MAASVCRDGNSPYCSRRLIRFKDLPGPPYMPKNTALGGVPTTSLDVPITSIYLALFILGAVCHMTILQINNRRKHKFLISGLMFGFCMARTVTCIMRIVWATRPSNIRIAIAAQIFVAAGVVLLFAINAVFAQRIVRAMHPTTGWHPGFGNFFRAIYALIVVSLIMLITVTVLSFYTLNTDTRRIARDIQLYGQSAFLLVAFLPIPLVIAGLTLPRKTRVEKFGSGRFRNKIIILLSASTLLSLGAAFRLGTSAKNPRPRSHPAWFDSKACFYIFDFSIDVIVVLLYALLRVDRRFHVPNGAGGPGDYSGAKRGLPNTTAARIVSEEEDLGDANMASSRLDNDEVEVIQEGKVTA